MIEDQPRRGPQSADVVVATYGRPVELRRCLTALADQVLADTVQLSVIVGVRREDGASARVATDFGVSLVISDGTSLLPVLDECVRFGHGDLVLFVDDDAEPGPMWVQRHMQWYAETSVGAVGGSEVPSKAVVPRGAVGRVTWFGRLIGNHDCATVCPCKVDVLKGVNMSVRRELYRSPPHLLGGGAELHWEVWLCNAVSAAKRDIVFDPGITVVHRSAPRVAGASRRTLTPMDSYAFGYNFMRVMLPYVPYPRKAAILVYGIIVGDWGAPGPVRAAVGVMHGDCDVMKRVCTAIKGRVQGAKDAAAGDDRRVGGGAPAS